MTTFFAVAFIVTAICFAGLLVAYYDRQEQRRLAPIRRAQQEMEVRWSRHEQTCRICRRNERRGDGA